MGLGDLVPAVSGGDAVSRKLCESAKRGHICGDDLCYGGDLTLCGFDKYEWDCMLRELREEEGDDPLYLDESEVAP